VVGRFVDAIQQGDLDGMVAILTDNAKLTMPPDPFEFNGPRPIAELLDRVALGQDLKVVLTRANHDPALGYYRPDPNANIYRASAILVLSVAGEQVSSITRFGDKSLFACLGLPRTLPSTE
jgi:RNA polymerase sigma-70 factor (ECF subfamily)